VRFSFCHFHKDVLLFNDTFCHQHTFLLTPFETKKLPSATIADGKEDLSDVTSKNIIIIKLEEILKDARKAIEEHMKATEEGKNVVEEMRALEEKEMKDFPR
jgi:hypothetical protein